MLEGRSLFYVCKTIEPPPGRRPAAAAAAAAAAASLPLLLPWFFPIYKSIAIQEAAAAVTNYHVRLELSHL